MMNQSKFIPISNTLCQNHDLLAGTVTISTKFEYTQEFIDLMSNIYGIVLSQDLQGASDKRQSEFVAGRLCARQALLELSGIIDIPAKNDDGSSKWMRGYIGSITHSHQNAVAIVSRQDSYLGVGIDLEQLIAASNIKLLSKKLLTKTEVIRFSTQLNHHRSFMLTLIFSLKESLFKALYPIVGKRFYFQEAEVVSFDINGIARLRLLSDLNNDWQAGCEIDAIYRRNDDLILTTVYIPA